MKEKAISLKYLKKEEARLLTRLKETQGIPEQDSINGSIITIRKLILKAEGKL